MPRAILLVRPDAHDHMTSEIRSARSTETTFVHGVSIGSADPCPQDWIPCRDQAEAVRLQAWIHSLACPACDGTTFEDPAPGAWYWKCTECELQIAPDDDVSSSFERAKGARMKPTDALASGMNAVYEAQAAMKPIERGEPKWGEETIS